MKRFALAAALTLWAVAPASGHPGHGAESVTVQGDSLRYSPASVTVATGESVVWFWQGTLSRNHSVTADPGQAETFDSDPAGPPTTADHPVGDSFSHTFTSEGRFTYYCKNHASMRGDVEVIPPPPPANPLRLKRVQVAVRGERVRVRYSVSKRVDLVARIAERRGSRWHTVKIAHDQAKRGEHRLKLGVKKLDPGPHRLTLTAFDRADRRVEVRKRFSL